jgi:exocyst complex component 4
MSRPPDSRRPGYNAYGSNYDDPYTSRSNQDPYGTRTAAGGGAAANSNPYGYENNSSLDNDPYAPRAIASEPSQYTTYSGTAATSAPEPPPRRSERRAGAYGANTYGNTVQSFREPSPPPSQQQQRPRSQSSNRRSIGAGWNNRSPTRRPPGDRAGGASRQIEEVLQTIKSDWPFLTEEKCVPVLVALQFMDDSSLGLARKYDAFRDIHGELQVALKQIVNEEHQGFNSSIGRFHAIQHALQTSQTKIRGLKEALVGARENLSADKPELAGLAKTSQNFDDMLMTLGDIEDLQNIPDQLEARISEKRFIGAVELLKGALKKIRKPEMAEIGALSDLKVYLSNQEHALTDILNEELHNHLYLKSPYCENRWKPHASQHVRGINREKETMIGERQLYQFLDQLDIDTVMTDDATKNPEADTFAYIQLLVESLNSLGRLESAVETMAQRLPIELFRVVEKTTNEIEQRYPASLRSGLAFNEPLNFKDPARAAVLNDLFGTMYARFEAIAEGHRVVHEVISGITKRDGFRGSSTLTGGFRELWKLYQSEMRSLFHDYLSSDADMFGQSNGMAGQNIYQKNLRDKSKVCMIFIDYDQS